MNEESRKTGNPNLCTFTCIPLFLIRLYGWTDD
jgi:hypothetical protein